MPKTCFVISPIGLPGTPTRLRSNDVYQYIISPVVRRLGYTLTRADKPATPGDIPTRIIDKLRNDELVIADLTDNNPNVFYELAIRHAVRKPIIHMIKEGERIPFDLSHQNCIQYETGNPKERISIRHQLEEQIQALEENPEAFHNPLTISIMLETVRNNDEALGISVSEILNQIHEVRRELRASDEEIQFLNAIDKIERAFDIYLFYRNRSLPRLIGEEKGRPDGTFDDEKDSARLHELLAEQEELKHISKNVKEVLSYLKTIPH